MFKSRDRTQKNGIDEKWFKPCDYAFEALLFYFDPCFRFFVVLFSYRRRGWYRAAYCVVSPGEDSVPSLCEGSACLKDALSLWPCTKMSHTPAKNSPSQLSDYVH